MGFDKSCQFLQDNRTLLYCFRKNTEGAVLPGHTHSTGRKSCRANVSRNRGARALARAPLYCVDPF